MTLLSNTRLTSRMRQWFHHRNGAVLHDEEDGKYLLSVQRTDLSKFRKDIGIHHKLLVSKKYLLFLY